MIEVFRGESKMVSVTGFGPSKIFMLLRQRFPTSLVPGSSFVEDSFSMNGVEGVWFGGELSSLYLLCTIILGPPQIIRHYIWRLGTPTLRYLTHDGSKPGYSCCTLFCTGCKCKYWGVGRAGFKGCQCLLWGCWRYVSPAFLLYPGRVNFDSALDLFL